MCEMFFSEPEKAIFNYLISLRNPQRLSELYRNWNSFSKQVLTGRAFASKLGRFALSWVIPSFRL